MSLGRNSQTANHTELWQPQLSDNELLQHIGVWRDKPTLESERAVAKRLAKLSHTVIKGQDMASPNRRAETAALAQTGPCTAHVESTIGFATSNGLSTVAAWNGHNASAIWLGELYAWKINAYSSAASLFLQEYKDQAISEGIFALTSLLVDTGLVAQVTIHPKESRSDGQLPVEAILTPDATGINPFAIASDYVLLPPEPTLAMLQANS